MSLVLGREYEKKYNPLKVSINAPDNTTADAFDILIYNGNNINMHKAVAKDIVELDALPKGHYILTIQSGSFVRDIKFIELVDFKGNENTAAAGDVVYLNVLNLDAGSPDLFRSSPTLSSAGSHYNISRYYEHDLFLSDGKYKLKALPAAKILWAKYKILATDGTSEWNEIQLARFMDATSAFNDILPNNRDLPISIWKLNTGDNFTLEIADGIYNMSLPVKYFEDTINQINRPDTRAFYHKLNESFYEYVKTIYTLPEYRNFLYNVDFYTTHNEGFNVKFKDVFNEEPMKYFTGFSTAEILHISNTLNFIGSKSPLLKEISYCAKPNGLTSLQINGDNIASNNFIKQCVFIDEDDFFDNSHLYKGIMLSILNHYYREILNEDFYEKWESELNWSYDKLSNEWSNGDRVISEYYGIACDTPKNEFAANAIYYLYSNEFPPSCTDNTVNLLRSILFDPSVNKMSYDKHIKSTSIYITGDEDQDKIIDISLNVKSMEQGLSLRKVDLLVKNNSDFFEIMTLTPQPGDVLTEADFVDLKSELTINKNSRSAIYYFSGINFHYGDGVSNNFNPVDHGLVFPIDNIAHDLLPPEMVTESMNVELTPLDEMGTELIVTFSVKENYSMSTDLNSFIYIKSPGIKPFYIEMFGYGINTGNSGYFTDTGQCMLRTILPSYYPSGEYTIANVELYDDANNVSRYNENDSSFTPAVSKFMLNNEYPDTTAPEINRESIMFRHNENSSNLPDESTRFPVVFLNVKDNHSGVGEVVFTILDSNQNEHTVFSLPENLYLEMLGKEEKDIYNIAFPIYHRFENADDGLTLTSLTVKDKAHNPAALDMINISLEASPTSANGNDKNTELNWKIIGNDFGIYFKTSGDFNYSIQKSSDLVDWITIQEVEGNDGNYYFMDTLDETAASFYYRSKSIKRN